MYSYWDKLAADVQHSVEKIIEHLVEAFHEDFADADHGEFEAMEEILEARILKTREEAFADFAELREIAGRMAKDLRAVDRTVAAGWDSRALLIEKMFRMEEDNE